MPMKITDTSSGLAQSLLKELLHYDPLTGVFTWLVSRNRAVKVGDVAGCIQKGEWYRIIRIGPRGCARTYKASRLAFLYMTGKWPAETVDHVNGKRDDDRWENLREATMAQQCANRGRRSENSSGIKGVGQFRGCSKWYAQISINGKRMYLGSFSRKEDAARVYAAALKEAHGTFARADEREYVS